MEDERIVIYKDDELVFEVDKLFHSVLLNKNKKFFKLSEEKLDVLLKQVSLDLMLKRIKEKELSLDNNPTCYNPTRCFIGNIPIIKSGLPFAIQEPYNVFNPALYYISTFLTLDQANTEINDDINMKIKEDNLYCKIFPETIFDVKGFLVYFEQDKETIMFFGFKDDIQTLDFLEFL